MPAAEPMTQEIVERLKELLIEWKRLEDAFHDAVPDQGDPGDGGVAGRALCQFLYDNAETFRSTLTNLTPSAVERIDLDGDLDIAAMARRDVEEIFAKHGPAMFDAIRALALPSEPPSQAPAVSLTKEYDDYLILLMLGELHANVPEDQRPMAMCDLSDEQAERALKAVHAVKRVIVTEISNSLREQPPSQGDVEGRAREAWQPIETAPEWDGKSGPFIDVTWAGVVHRYLPVPRRETDCFCENGVIMRKHGYPSMLTVFDPQPTHWMPSPPLASKEDARS